MSSLSIRYYRNALGVYLGAWDIDPPSDAIEVAYPPDDARQMWEPITNTWRPVSSPPPETISRRQFFQALANADLLDEVAGTAFAIISEAEALSAVQAGAIPEPLADIIDQLPAEQQFAARMLVSGASEFSRTHNLSVFVRDELEWSQAQLDQFWRLAYAL